MLHLRNRHVFKLLLKKIKFTPVLFVQGARQVGKSVLIRDLLAKKISSIKYLSLDQKILRETANENPESFISIHKEKTLAIDEAQKAPCIFDAIKFSVDEERRPGKFILLGSTEFSRMTKIRESLTGRASRIMLYPMNLSESLKLEINPSKNISLINKTSRATRNELLQYLERGGLPGIFGIRSDKERKFLFQSWIDLTVERDAKLFIDLKVDSGLLLKLLELIATSEDTSKGNLAQICRRDIRVIEKHLLILQTLFVINKLPPQSAGTGKDQYFLLDVGLAKYLGANHQKLMKTWLLLEYLSQYSYQGVSDVNLSFYRTTKGRIIDLILEKRGGPIVAIKIYEYENIKFKDLEIMKSFKRRIQSMQQKQKDVQLIALYPGLSIHEIDHVDIIPYESIV